MAVRDFSMEPRLELGDIQPHGLTISHAGPLDLGGALRLDGVLSWFLPVISLITPQHLFCQSFQFSVYTRNIIRPLLWIMP